MLDNIFILAKADPPVKDCFHEADTSEKIPGYSKLDGVV